MKYTSKPHPQPLSLVRRGEIKLCFIFDSLLRSIPDILPCLLAVKSFVSNKIAAKYLSVLVLETVTDLILPLR